MKNLCNKATILLAEQLRLKNYSDSIEATATMQMWSLWEKLIKVVKTPRLGLQTISAEKMAIILLKSLKFVFKIESSIFKTLTPSKLMPLRKMCLLIDHSKCLQPAEVAQTLLIKSSYQTITKIKSWQERKSSFSRRKLLTME